MHPNNPHKGRYDFLELASVYPPLRNYLIKNDQGGQSILFSDPNSVVALNTALLVTHYDIERWVIPEGHLCPPIPGRADYIHHIAELVYTESDIHKEDEFHCLDIGTGASIVYPIIGTKAYNWSFTGSDIDLVSIKNARAIINRNHRLINKVSLRHQTDNQHIFKGIIRSTDTFDLSICNPPFFKSAEEAAGANSRKNKNLFKKYPKIVERVFQGTSNELWCSGGEHSFILNMIRESSEFRNQCRWFSTLVSNKRHLIPFEKTLQKFKKCSYKIIPMAHGQKSSHILAWRFN